MMSSVALGWLSGNGGLPKKSRVIKSNTET